jgi:hypothetical protein
VSIERLIGLDDDALGETIRGLDLSWPEPAPDVFDAVVRDLHGRRRPRRAMSRTTIVVLVAATLLVLAAIAAAATIAFHIGAVSIVPVPSGSVSLPASPVAPAALGVPISFHAAEEALGGALPLPRRLGPPDRVWLQEGTVAFEGDTQGRIATIAWRPRPGLPRIPGTPFGATLMLFEGEDTVAIKLIDAPWRQLIGHEGYLITAPHELDLLVGGRVETFRVTGTVVIWQQRDLTQRLETALHPSDAVRLAFG